MHYCIIMMRMAIADDTDNNTSNVSPIGPCALHIEFAQYAGLACFFKWSHYCLKSLVLSLTMIINVAAGALPHGIEPIRQSHKNTSWYLERTQMALGIYIYSVDAHQSETIA